MLTDNELEQKAQTLREKLKRHKVEVREVQRVLGLRSTSHAAYIMHKLVERGLLEYDAPLGDERYGEYFFPTETK